MHAEKTDGEEHLVSQVMNWVPWEINSEAGKTLAALRDP